MGIKNFLSKNRVVDIQSCLPDGVVLITTAGLIQWFNSVAVDLFLLPDTNISNMPIDDFLENGLETISTIAETNQSSIIKLVNADEYIEVNTLFERHETSQKTNNNKNSFFIKLSNELRSPIHSVIGFSQAIIDGLGGSVSEKQAKYLKIINKNSTDLLYFFNKLVELSQTENDSFDKEIKYFDIVDTIKAIVKTNEQLYADKNLELVLDIDEMTKRTIYTDEKAFKAMFQTLLETIIRSTDIGTIQINTTSATEEFLATHNMGDYSAIVLSITSSTNTILESEIETLFDPYVIVDKSNKRTLVRSLALASVRNILNYLHGVIWVETAPLKGTIFNVIIPFEKETNE